MKTQVNFKIDAVVKRQAQKRAKQIGLSLNAIVNATLTRFARVGDFYVSSESNMTPKMIQIAERAIQEYKEGMTKGPFKTTADLMKSLES